MSFITKRHLPRRTFLHGMGVTLALPLLDAMIPAGTRHHVKNAGASPLFFLSVYSPPEY